MTRAPTLFRAGRLTQLTRDDTWVQDQVEARRLTAEQARHHPFGHLLTQCLGLDEEPIPQVLSGTAEPGDTYLLCTDGLVGMISDGELAAILSEQLDVGPSADEAEDDLKPVRALVQAANGVGGRDNITAALVRIGQLG